MHWTVVGSNGSASLQLRGGAPVDAPGSNEVHLRLAAVSLNYRDILICRGLYPMPLKPDLVPVSDGAGTIVAVGPGVESFAIGDRVMTNFFVHWKTGGIRREFVETALGSSTDGVLASDMILPTGAVTRIPHSLSFADAATLPCAGVTAWNALFHTAGLSAGDTVLLQGTGGVSSFALQFAKSRGLSVIQTSSSDEKLSQAHARGADMLVNYRATPEWDQEVLRLTDGRGVDAVVEVGGAGTLERSIRATRMGGTIAAVGLVAGLGTIDPLPILTGVVRVSGVYVGSHAMAAEMLAMIDVSAIAPVIDRTFTFDDAKAAFAYLESGTQGSGKVVIAL